MKKRTGIFKGTMIQQFMVGTLVLLCAGILFFSCKDKATGPLGNSSDFRFKVIVKDTTGAPVNGLRVSAWNILSVGGGFYKTSSTQKLSKSSQTSAAVALGFAMPVAAHVTFSAYNLKDEVVATLVDQQMAAGRYSVQWGIPWDSPAIPSGVYKIKLVATSSDTVRFQDYIYAVYHQYDPQINVIGWTLPSGEFETTESLLFPIVLDPPTFIHTDASGPDPLGTFHYTDSAAIVLTDTLAHTQQTIHVAIGKHENIYTITWRPTATSAFSVIRPTAIETKIVDVRDPILPAEWKLYQNYPNPFN